MSPAPWFERYEWAAGRETMLRLGPAAGPTVVVALPLFEEANRTRAILVATLRLLAVRGIGGALPDLPGQGDSLIATRDARLADWRQAFGAAAAALPGPIHVAAIRGGALVDADAEAASRWHLSPLAGAAQARELHRQRALAEQAYDLFSGNDLAPEMLTSLQTAEATAASPKRIVRLTGDRGDADRSLAFPPPWRAAEPRRDDALSAALADDLAGWIGACGGR